MPRFLQQEMRFCQVGWLFAIVPLCLGRLLRSAPDHPLEEGHDALSQL
jgi:hypothetical protein